MQKMASIKKKMMSDLLLPQYYLYIRKEVIKKLGISPTVIQK
jgi:hypothetical protein